MVALNIYLTAFFLAATRFIHGYNFAGDRRGGFGTGVTRLAMRGGGLVNGFGIGGNAVGTEGLLSGQDGFGRAVNSRVLNMRPSGSTVGGAGNVGGSDFGAARGIIGPLNAGLRSRANGVTSGVGRVDGGAPGGAIGRGGEFNSGTFRDERSRIGTIVGENGLNGGALTGTGGSGDVLKVVVMNDWSGGLDGQLTGRRSSGDGNSNNGARSSGDSLNNIDKNGGLGDFRPRMVGDSVNTVNEGALGSWDIGSSSVLGGMPRGANMLGGPAISGLVNGDQANNVDFSGQFGRLSRSNGEVNGLQSSGLRQGRINGGFDNGGNGGTFAGGLGNGGVDAGPGEPGGFRGGINGRAFNGGFGRLASGATDGSRSIDRGEFGGVSGPGQRFNDATLLNQLGAVSEVRGQNDGVFRDAGANGGLSRSGHVLKVVVVNGGLEGLDGRLADRVASGVGDSNTGTSARRLESSDQNVGFRTLGSVVGDGGRGLNRGALSTGGGLDNRSSGGILTNLLGIVSNLVNDLGSVSGASLGDLASNGRSGGISSRFNGGNGRNDPANDGFANGGSSGTNGFGGEFDGTGGLIRRLDALLSRGFNEGRKY